MKKFIMVKESIFEESAENIFKRLQDFATLTYIAKPYMFFKPMGKEGKIVWEEGDTYRFKLKILNIIPFGIHTIKVIDINREKYLIYTNEENKFVNTWNHRIEIKKIGLNKSSYKDEVEINAGIWTPIIYGFAKIFYTHRQRKWKKLLKTM